MKIYIVGSVASGKTTLGKKLSKIINTPCIHLDGIVHIKDKSNKVWGNIRREDHEINRLFLDVMEQENWLIEDAGRKCFNQGMEDADTIIYLKPSIHIRKKRVIVRYIKQKLGVEYCLYKPSIKMLKFMFQALQKYESGIDDLEQRLVPYNFKVKVLKNKKNINTYLRTVNAQYEGNDLVFDS